MILSLLGEGTIDFTSSCALLHSKSFNIKVGNFLRTLLIIIHYSYDLFLVLFFKGAKPVSFSAIHCVISMIMFCSSLWDFHACINVSRTCLDYILSKLYEYVELKRWFKAIAGSLFNPFSYLNTLIHCNPIELKRFYFLNRCKGGLVVKGCP